MNSNRTVIRVSGITKIYREGTADFRALSEVDLEIRAGELTLLMGPSGSGKTTLLSILGCILRATNGSLEVLGESVEKLAEAELPRIRRAAVQAGPTVPTAAFSAAPARPADAPTIGVNCRFATWGLAAARVGRTASS